MTTEIFVPALGESISEATVGKWLKNLGDKVKIDEPLVELETDKVSIEVPAPTAGTLTKILVKEGDTVMVGALIASLDKSDHSNEKKVSSLSSQPIKSEISSSTRKLDIKEPSPAARRLINENKLNLENITGSGKRGQILKEDILKMPGKEDSSTIDLNKPESHSFDQTSKIYEKRVPMSRLRQTIAQRLKDSQNTAAMLTTFNEIDMSAVIKIRKCYKDLFIKKHGIKLGFMGLFTKAVCHALQEIPNVNAEIDGQDIVYKKFCHIGIAVGTDKGLVVPVIRNADRMSVAQVEKMVAELGKKAREGKLTLEDMQGGTFTISNGGVYGSLLSTPILNAPQSGILGMHKIDQRPVVVDNEIVIRPMMYLALSYDHRIVDGKEAVTFLVRVKENLEDPQRMIIDL